MNKKQINNRWNTIAIPYLIKNFSKKNMVKRFFFLVIALVIVLIPSITMYCWSLNQIVIEPLGKNSFWYISLIYNPGVGFSLFGDSPTWLVFFIQIFTDVIILIMIMFSKKWYFIFLLWLAFVGGMFNIIDRFINAPWPLYPNMPDWSVIDYFTFGFMNFAIFNFPDIFIVIGTFGFVLLYIINVIILIIKEHKEEGKNEDKHK